MLGCVDMLQFRILIFAVLVFQGLGCEQITEKITDSLISGKVGGLVLLPAQIPLSLEKYAVIWHQVCKSFLISISVWKNGTIQYAAPYKGRARLYTNNFTLQLNNVTQDDSGHYQVTLKHGRLENRGKVRLEVLGTPAYDNVTLLNASSSRWQNDSYRDSFLGMQVQN
ncbi:uncharacterized protein LOC122813438 isoform X2 [Protopterus annectens]|uniref:uncharacterized protein LOC122813438 isoform X2 n=1 Tax=Protopterus annectens TaxID=7888 RepID=UPI001CFBFFEB|nr:uncharacterized protein LOC122813438 isoform X2 [Protopterus annectens]